MLAALVLLPTVASFEALRDFLDGVGTKRSAEREFGAMFGPVMDKRGLAEWLAFYGMPVTRADLDRTYKEMDLDGNGLSLSELVSEMRLRERRAEVAPKSAKDLERQLGEATSPAAVTALIKNYQGEPDAVQIAFIDAIRRTTESDDDLLLKTFEALDAESVSNGTVEPFIDMILNEDDLYSRYETAYETAKEARQFQQIVEGLKNVKTWQNWAEWIESIPAMSEAEENQVKDELIRAMKRVPKKFSDEQDDDCPFRIPFTFECASSTNWLSEGVVAALKNQEYNILAQAVTDWAKTVPELESLLSTVAAPAE